jgi:hypothetical protein
VETILLLNEHEYTVFPLSSFALTVASGSTRRIQQHFIGALVVYQDGSVFRINGINFIDLWGATIWRKVFSFVNGGTRRILVDLHREENLGFKEVQRLIIDHLHRNPSVLSDFFEENLSLELVVGQVSKASTFPELFNALRVGPPEDQLDILSAPGRQLTLIELLALSVVLAIAIGTMVKWTR